MMGLPAVALMGIIAALSIFGCSAPRACEAGSGDGVGATVSSEWHLESEHPTGSSVLASAHEQTTFRLEANLTDLPEVWPAGGAVVSGAIELKLSLAYVQTGGNGEPRTEMPRF